MNIVGVVLLVAGFGLLIVEAFTPSVGVMGAGGVLGIVLGALFLFEEQPLPTPALKVSLAMILPVAILLGLVVIFVGRKVVEAQRRPPLTGSESLVGQFATTRTRIDGEGKVFIHGEYWDARSPEPVDEGERVKVVSVDGLMLGVGREHDDQSRALGHREQIAQPEHDASFVLVEYFDPVEEKNCDDYQDSKRSDR